MGLISRVSSRTYRFLVVIQTKMSSDEQFEAAGGAGAHVYPLQCSALRKGGYVMMKGKPCKMIDITDEGYLSLMDDQGDVRDDLHCEHDPVLFKEIKDKFDAGDEMMIGVLQAMGREQPIGIKAMAASK